MPPGVRGSSRYGPTGRVAQTIRAERDSLATRPGGPPAPQPLILQIMGRERSTSWYDLGELAQLVSRLYGQGEPITLIPVLRETANFFGGLENNSKTVLTLDHWEIRYSYGGAEGLVAEPTLREAVHAALTDLNRRADAEAS